MSLLELFCDVDDFWLRFEPQWKANRVATGKQRERAGQLCPSEVMTILIHFHQSHYQTFKAYYTEHVQVHLIDEDAYLVTDVHLEQKLKMPVTNSRTDTFF